MIYTLTLNPALDVTISVGRLYRDRTNRTKLKSVSAGGKGFNTSRALNCLGMDNIAIAFTGGLFACNIKKILEDEGISSRLIPIEDNIRINIKVIENENGRLIEFNETGPLIKHNELDSLISILKDLKPEPEYVIISGSLPNKVDTTIYRKIIGLLEKGKVKTLLDTSGEALYHGLLAIPSIVKINKNEMNQVCRDFFKKRPEELIKDLLGKGVEIIMLTDGPGEASYYSKTENYIIKPSDTTGNYKTGSGDAVNAGLIYGVLKSYGVEEMLKFAIACGDANIVNEIPGSFEMKKVHKLLQSIKIIRSD